MPKSNFEKEEEKRKNQDKERIFNGNQIKEHLIQLREEFI